MPADADRREEACPAPPEKASPPGPALSGASGPGGAAECRSDPDGRRPQDARAQWLLRPALYGLDDQHDLTDLDGVVHRWPTLRFEAPHAHQLAVPPPH